jgi:histidyl-tRNA synthetase
MKKADSSRALLAVIIGDDEVMAGEVSVKPLRQESEQARVPIAQVSHWISDFLYSERE